MTISLELAVVDDNLSGQATSSGHPVKDFNGWIGLMSAIETLLVSDLRARASRGEDPTAGNDR
jgi:hypothetical protein